MASASDPATRRPGPLSRLADRARRWRDGRIADPAFQAWAARFPLTRPIANRRAAALFDLVAGFVHSQVLLACVELDLFRRLEAGPADTGTLARASPLDPRAMERLLQAAAALDLVRRRAGRWTLGPLGAALLGAPGVEEMIRHHPMFYRDLEDPLALLAAPRGSTELARYWSYFGEADVGAEDAARYSKLMAASQAMVAAETLAVHPMTGIRCLMDVGGGEGAFLSAALRATPGLTGIVLDLPPVAARAERALQQAGLSSRARVVGGSFRDPLPEGADAISLVRVLYDHDDPTVRALLGAAFEALPAGGRIIVSEPMRGNRAGDAYFGLYTAAMTSGTPRSPETHASLLAAAGFARIRVHRPRQAFATRVVSARKP